MTDPIDDTDSHPTSPTADPTSPPADPAATAGAASNLRVDPDRPAASEWREPAWFPPRDKAHDKPRGPSMAALVGGLVLVAIGLYFFLDRTLGIAMPRLQWGTIWPVILIVIGAVVLVRSIKPRS